MYAVAFEMGKLKVNKRSCLLLHLTTHNVHKVVKGFENVLVFVDFVLF